MPLINLPTVTTRLGPQDPNSGERPATTYRLGIDGINLYLDHPGRVVHTALNDDRAVIERQAPRWAMELTIAAEHADSEMGFAIQNFMAQMSDLNNYAEWPLGMRANTTYTSTTTIQSISGNALVLGSGGSGLAANQFLRIGTRLVMATSFADAGNQLIATPNVGAVGDTVAPATTFRARLDGDGSYEMPSRNGLIGPFMVKLKEVI